MTPWERRLLTGRRYFISDLRVVSGDEELALDDVGEVHCRQTGLQRVFGLSTVEVQSRDRRRDGLVLRNVRRGAQLAALIELLAADPIARTDEDAARETMRWEPRVSTPGKRDALTAILLVVASIVAVVVGLHGKAPSVTYPDDDAIYPHGVKRGRAAIVEFMNADVMPWARRALAPIVGSPDKVTCATCHGGDAGARGWRMPGVAALPRPIVREAGWEKYGGPMDAQMRNAIYGYSAESDNTSKATYMREVVMPGMARLLHRPAYDFTRTYEYNREHFAFGCYHCHKVK